MEDDLHPHLQNVSQLSCEVVFIVLVLHLSQLLLPEKRHTADLKVICSWGECFLLAQMQVADTLFLVDLEVAFVISVVDAVAHVVAEGGQGRGELKDVVAVAQVADVQVQLEGVFNVNAGQADVLVNQLRGKKQIGVDGRGKRSKYNKYIHIELLARFLQKDPLSCID